MRCDELCTPSRRRAGARSGPRPRARLGLAALAHVRAPPPHDDLADRGPAPRTRQAGAAVDQEAVLERAARAVDVAEVVDRGALGLDSRAERLLDPVAQPRPVGPGEPAG